MAKNKQLRGKKGDVLTGMGMCDMRGGMKMIK